VIVVVHLHKWLDLGPLLDLLLTHSSRHRAGMSINASHQRMTIRPLRCAIVIVLTNTHFINTTTWNNAMQSINTCWCLMILIHYSILKLCSPVSHNYDIQVWYNYEEAKQCHHKYEYKIIRVMLQVLYNKSSTWTVYSYEPYCTCEQDHWVTEQSIMLVMLW